MNVTPYTWTETSQGTKLIPFSLPNVILSLPMLALHKKISSGDAMMMTHSPAPLSFLLESTLLLSNCRKMSISDGKGYFITCMAGLGWYLNCLRILVHKMDKHTDVVDL